MAAKKETGKTTSYFKGVKAEMRKVVWPSKKELVNYTGVVILVSMIVSAIVYLLDTVILGLLKFVL